MPICEKIKIKHRKPCVGDMRHLITIKTYTITTPTGNGVDFGITKSVDISVFAALETRRGIAVFDGQNVEHTATHFFYIRYDPNMTFEKKLSYEGQWYNVILVEDFERRHEFYLITCNVRGTEAT